MHVSVDSHIQKAGENDSLYSTFAKDVRLHAEDLVKSFAIYTLGLGVILFAIEQVDSLIRFVRDANSLTILAFVAGYYSLTYTLLATRPTSFIDWLYSKCGKGPFASIAVLVIAVPVIVALVVAQHLFDPVLFTLPNIVLGASLFFLIGYPFIDVGSFLRKGIGFSHSLKKLLDSLQKDRKLHIESLAKVRMELEVFRKELDRVRLTGGHYFDTSSSEYGYGAMLKELFHNLKYNNGKPIIQFIEGCYEKICRDGFSIPNTSFFTYREKTVEFAWDMINGGASGNTCRSFFMTCTVMPEGFLIQYMLDRQLWKNPWVLDHLNAFAQVRIIDDDTGSRQVPKARVFIVDSELIEASLEVGNEWSKALDGDLRAGSASTDSRRRFFSKYYTEDWGFSKPQQYGSNAEPIGIEGEEGIAKCVADAFLESDGICKDCFSALAYVWFYKISDSLVEGDSRSKVLRNFWCNYKKLEEVVKKGDTSIPKDFLMVNQGILWYFDEPDMQRELRCSLNGALTLSWHSKSIEPKLRFFQDRQNGTVIGFDDNNSNFAYTEPVDQMLNSINGSSEAMPTFMTQMSRLKEILESKDEIELFPGVEDPPHEGSNAFRQWQLWDKSRRITLEDFSAFVRNYFLTFSSGD